MISISASKLEGSRPPKNAFDFNFEGESYWWSNDDQVFISFCLKKGSAYLTKYEILNSYYGSYPKKWSFSGSNTNGNWKNTEVTDHLLTTKTFYQVDWNHGPYRCFKFESIENNEGNKPVDIFMLEIYGTYFPNGIKEKTCYFKTRRIPLFMIILLIY